ncbi:MAG: hydroxychlorobactene glucosyltransferase CruC [Anaerolineae bacterium]
MIGLRDLLLSPIGQQAGVLAYLLFILVNTALNWLTLPRLGTHRPPRRWPRVAVLVPARNEGRNIAHCLRSLLAQDYPFFSVWVLDDQSDDGTAAIVNELAVRDARVHLLFGQPLPADWLGKPWACWQLAQAASAQAELLLFVDADTWHAPDMLRASVAALLAEGCDLLTVLPRQVLGTPAEWLSVPVLPWSLFTHFPLWLTRRVRWPGLAAAVGQHMLWRREAYERIGGHAAVRRHVAEDMALARLAAREGLRCLLLPGPKHVFCRMYRSAAEVLEGFGKNLFSVFNRRWPAYLFVWLWLGVAFVSPLILLIGQAMAGWPVSPRLAGLSLGTGWLIWALAARSTALPVTLAFFYPLIVLSNIFLAFHSLGQTMTRRARWKGRRVV